MQYYSVQQEGQQWVVCNSTGRIISNHFENKEQADIYMAQLEMLDREMLGRDIFQRQVVVSW